MPTDNEEYTYKTAGFDKFLRRGARVEREITEDSASLEVPEISSSSLTTSIPESKLESGLGDSTKMSGVTSASSGSIATGSGVRATASLFDSVDPTRVMFGICEVTAYMDSIANNNEVPYGSDAIANGHDVAAWYNYAGNLDSSHPNTGISYTFHIQNNMGDAHSYHFVIRWRYLGRKVITGTA